MHIGSTQMYQDLKEFYWWPNMEKKKRWLSKWQGVRYVNR
jgi:hypothetical protein